MWLLSCVGVGSCMKISHGSEGWGDGDAGGVGSVSCGSVVRVNTGMIFIGQGCVSGKGVGLFCGGSGWGSG